MSQHDMNIANADGATVRADLNNALAAIATCSSGATAPTTTFAYQFWADSANDLLKQRNAANSAWINVLTLSTGAPADADIPTVAATLAEMEAGTEAALRSMSPLRVKQAINASPAVVYASAAENAAGTIEGKAVDPLGIREAFNCTGGAPVYACRAWVNFNGTGTVAIRASGNVSSITDNGTGDYTVNFTTAMPDANYSATGSVTKADTNNDGNMIIQLGGNANTFSTYQTSVLLRALCIVPSSQTAGNPDRVTISIFR